MLFLTVILTSSSCWIPSPDASSWLTPEPRFQSFLRPQLQPLLLPLQFVFSQLGEPLFLVLGAGPILQFGSRRFSWSFQLASVSVPILGSDFLSNHALLVDVARAHVLDADSLDVLSPLSSPSATDPFCAHLQTAPNCT